MFADSLANWTNDDVLLTKPARDRLAAEYPRALRVLDWPELRLLFANYEAPATEEATSGRKLSRMIVAAWRRQAAARTSRALGSRYWTERARGLSFQVLANNLGLAAQAMSDDKAFGAWKRVRADALATLPLARDLPARIRDLVKDLEDQDVWVVPAWATPPEPPPPSPELDVLLARIRVQRFETQIAYIGHKIGDAAPPAQRDASRYARFRTAIIAARDAFDAGDISAKIAALRAMETYAYRDLRDFITDHQGGA